MNEKYTIIRKGSNFHNIESISRQIFFKFIEGIYKLESYIAALRQKLKNFNVFKYYTVNIVMLGPKQLCN